MVQIIFCPIVGRKDAVHVFWRMRRRLMNTSLLRFGATGLNIKKVLREVITDYGAIPFRLYHSWFNLQGFDHMVTHTWNSTVLDDRNGMIRFKNKLQILKKEIRVWVADQKKKQSGRVSELKSKLSDIDKALDQGGVNDDLL
ncbi:hypothetical protein Tco_0379985, partial [Tanacetum coccineum]